MSSTPAITPNEIINKRVALGTCDGRPEGASESDCRSYHDDLYFEDGVAPDSVEIGYLGEVEARETAQVKTGSHFSYRET